jgi:hypothetical protein
MDGGGVGFGGVGLGPVGLGLVRQGQRFGEARRG